MLAMHLHIRDYLKLDNDKERQEALDNWLEKNKQWIEQAEGRGGERREDNRTRPTPMKVATLYCDRVGLQVDDLADAIDWGFFADCARDDELGAPYEDATATVADE